MAFIAEENLPINKIRTSLLLMVNKELSALKKNNDTKINSKKITEAEEYYSSVNNYVVELKEEKFIPNFITSDVIQNKNIKNTCSFKSPDQLNNSFIGKIKYSSKNSLVIDATKVRDKFNDEFNKEENSDLKFDLEILGKRSDISNKKNAYFKKKTLKLDNQPFPKGKFSYYSKIKHFKK